MLKNSNRCNLESLLPNPNIVANVFMFVCVCVLFSLLLGDEEMWIKPQYLSPSCVKFLPFLLNLHNKIHECVMKESHKVITHDGCILIDLIHLGCVF